jgi:hypothetical protein
MFYLYPQDKATWAVDLQLFYGSGLLVAQVTDENARSVYDWYTHMPVRGTGRFRTSEDQDVTDIPLLIRLGVILPVRVSSADICYSCSKQSVLTCKKCLAAFIVSFMSTASHRNGFGLCAGEVVVALRKPNQPIHLQTRT